MDSGFLTSPSHCLIRLIDVKHMTLYFSNNLYLLDIYAFFNIFDMNNQFDLPVVPLSNFYIKIIYIIEIFLLLI
jgi:hypothetical protein